MALLQSLGIAEKPNCPCRAHARQMDAWGTKRCRENLATIQGWMQEGKAFYSWSEKVKAAALAIVTGAPKSLSGLIEEAICRAEEKEAKKG